MLLLKPKHVRHFLASFDAAEANPPGPSGTIVVWPGYKKHSKAPVSYYRFTKDTNVPCKWGWFWYRWSEMKMLLKT